MAKAVPTEAVEPSKKKGPDQYEIEHWASKVIDAHEIMNDPKKMKLVEKEIAKKKKALDNVPVKTMADLKRRANSMPEVKVEIEADED
jgi:hypothetical protein